MDTTGDKDNVGGVTVRAVTRASQDTAVAVIEAGPVQISSIWVVFLGSGRPRVAWPKNANGYPIISIPDDQVRQAVEAEIISRIPAWDQPAQASQSP